MRRSERNRTERTGSRRTTCWGNSVTGRSTTIRTSRRRNTTTRLCYWRGMSRSRTSPLMRSIVRLLLRVSEHWEMFQRDECFNEQFNQYRSTLCIRFISIIKHFKGKSVSLSGPNALRHFGSANLGRICYPGSSCAIVQDNGLAAAFTIAHEIGHVWVESIGRWKTIRTFVNKRLFLSGMDTEVGPSNWHQLLGTL